MAERKITSYVATLTPEQIDRLAELLRDRGWDFSTVPHAHWKAAGNKVNAVAYLSGKLTVQGGGTAEFVEFTLEPEILHTFSFNLPPEADPELDLTPHGGIDESGKGDFFGPLVIAGVCTDEQTAAQLSSLGVCDSKLIKSSARIKSLAAAIRQTVPGRFAVVAIGPEAYNRMYDKIGNLNRLLAWGHARVIENLLEKVPDCPRMLSDKFGAEHLIKRSLMERGRQVKLEQKTKAESDVAVAAASILSRDEFLRRMDKLSSELGITLPRGAGPAVLAAGRTIANQKGPATLAACAKLHFKTYTEILSTL